MATRSILLVDDEPIILECTKRLLHNKDYIIFTADNGLDGLAVLAEHPVQVVISDQNMDGMDGQEFLRRVTERYPDTIRLLLSGSIRSGTEELDAKIHRFLSKPWRMDNMMDVLSESFQQYDEQHAECA